MKEIIVETLIIGAGPAGLAAAMELSKAKKDFLIVEKDRVVGGLSKTYVFKEGDLEFRTDNGPHRFFSKNPYLYKFIGDLLKEKWIKVPRQTRQYIDGKFYDYPIKAFQALRNIGIFHATLMVFDYLFARIKYGLFKKPIKNFQDYVIANFGRSLGNFNMINYTEKIWGISADDIHVEWAYQRIKGLSLRTALLDAIKRIFKVRGSGKVKTLVDAFYYPEYGTGLIYETIEAKLKAQGYKILLNSEPIKVECDGKIMKSATIKTGEGELKVNFKNLVESVPIGEFMSLISPQVSSEIKSAMKRLRYRHQTYLFLTLNKDKITDDQWIYFPNKDIPFGRISEMKNFSQKMSPEGKTSLFIEFFCFEDEPVWQMTDKELLNLALPHLEKMGFCNRADIRSSYLIRQKNVYPIYDVAYKEYLSKIQETLDQFDNLYYIGRPGRFRYNNQDHSLEMGIAAARSIIDGVKYDIDDINAGNEYHEKGEIPVEEKND